MAGGAVIWAPQQTHPLPWGPVNCDGLILNCIVFLRPAPIPNAQLRGWREIQNYQIHKTHATERDGAPEFTHPDLDSAIFCRRPFISPIFQAPGAPLPTPNWAWGGEYETTADYAERYGTWRYAAIWSRRHGVRRISDDSARAPQYSQHRKPQARRRIREGRNYETTDVNRQTAGPTGVLRNRRIAEI